MWTQNYTPLAGSLALSALAAALPRLRCCIYSVLGGSPLEGIRRRPGRRGCGALFVYRMPVVWSPALTTALPSACFHRWIIFSAILLYRVAVESGKFEIIKDSLGGLTSDRRLQALLIAFCFGAFLESAAGWGAVAVAATMLIGLGSRPTTRPASAAGQHVPVTFGSIGIPLSL